ncbi:MAG: FIST signal transduction protein [Hyphomicrobiaceae bacterium]
MVEFAMAYGAGDRPDGLVSACAAQLTEHGGRYDLAFVYTTDSLADDLDGIIAGLKQRTEIDDWFGTVGVGVCVTGQACFSGPAIAVLACNLDGAGYRKITTPSSLGRFEQGSTQEFMAGLGVVHGDPRNPEVAAIVEQLADDNGLYLVGGLSAGEHALPQVAGAINEGGVTGVQLGAGLNVTVGLTQGCNPIGPAHTVTRGEHNILAQLDDSSAFEMLCEDLGVADGVDPRPWLGNVHAAVLVAGSDTGDYLVRNLIGLDPSNGLVAIAEEVEAGDRIMFVRRDAESAAKDVARMLEEMKSRSSAPPKGALYYSCVARGPNLFDEDSFELRAIQDVFGDIPLVGFFGNGEISNNRIYGYTGVLTLFS